MELKKLGNATLKNKEDLGSSRPFNYFYRLGEDQVVAYLLGQVQHAPEQSQRIAQQAHGLIEKVRAHKPEQFNIANLLQTYHLNSQEGLALMCLAEALLRIPDKQTRVRLIRDKISSVEWGKSTPQEETFIGKLANFGLATASHLIRQGVGSKGFLNTLIGLTRRVSEPIIYQSVTQAMKILGHQFVMGESIQEALVQAQKNAKDGYCHSYDMLGEAACTQEDANRYYQAYAQAIEDIGATKGKGDIFSQPSISVKLSALHPRYEIAKRERIQQELCPLVLDLARLAKKNGIGLTIDAEESQRLDLSLDIIEFISNHNDLKTWDGLGLVVQAYQKRAPLLLDYLIDMAQNHKRRLCIRLVKGAYWDSEIKDTQEKGLRDYSVFTHKPFTDLSYQVCAQKMFAAGEAIYPQFATHNAYTVAMILELAKDKAFEFQRLYGMGEALYSHLIKETNYAIPCRIYAPVGSHKDLLAYLVRRLLENGANTSFVHKIHDASQPIEALLADPIVQAQSITVTPHPKIPLPVDLFRPQRQNSQGLDLGDVTESQTLIKKIDKVKASMPWRASPLISGADVCLKDPLNIPNPTCYAETIGQAWYASEDLVNQAMEEAHMAFTQWDKTPVNTRAQNLEQLAALLENHREELMTLLIYEGGKTLSDALAEVREAVDFCRYYAAQARHLMGLSLSLPGPTGEENCLSLHGRGVFICISPWNFPLAIFIGQVVAALVSGNCVIAKPAHQTPLVAYRAVQLAYRAGIPKNALHFLPGKGSDVGDKLIRNPQTAGVAFTGSMIVAKHIAKTLLSRDNAPIVPLIAETGGMNAMIVDSSALLEQATQDIIISSFHSAGQRCSALRLLFVQEDIANALLDMLKGAMIELSVGDPSLLSTDVGPIIDPEALKRLQDYEEYLKETAQLIYRVPLGEGHRHGNFLAPQAWELPTPNHMTEEVFGPILHVVRFKEADLDHVINQINSTGYGLTLGLHSRIEETVRHVRQKARVGNLYINRSMTGAVVGVQPFGGEGFSGTGPKAGGPHYLTRFMVERASSQNTTASGGNASLLAELD